MSTPDTDARPGEPVMIAHVVQMLLAAAVTAGWVTIPDRTIDVVASAVGLALATVAAVIARSRVTPGAPITMVEVRDAIHVLLSEELDRIIAAAQPPAPEPAPEPAAPVDDATAPFSALAGVTSAFPVAVPVTPTQPHPPAPRVRYWQ
jgi:hypothetical protein